MALITSRDECIYTSCYCEENVWYLCERFRRLHLEELRRCYAVFISNPTKSVPLWRQSAGREKDEGFVVWDYHVIFVHKDSDSCRIYDLDTMLPFPCDFDQYFQETFREDSKLKSEYRRFFRAIPASQYLDTFASDRTHMLREDGTWMKPPPAYPPIQTANSTNNLNSHIDMTPGSFHGKVLDHRQFIAEFS